MSCARCGSGYDLFCKQGWESGSLFYWICHVCGHTNYEKVKDEAKR